MVDEPQIPEPGQRFNFAQHLIDLNRGRASKVALIDDQRSLTYGQLAQQIQCFAAALAQAGLRREERVLLVMQDCVDWPVAFLGALYGGVVPVAVNTLLTADDYIHMLEISRAQAVITCTAVLPVVRAALVKADHEVKFIIVAGDTPAGDQDATEPSAVAMTPLLNSVSPMAEPAHTNADDPGFWLFSSGSTGLPKGTVHTHANPYWTAELYGKPVLGLTEQDVCFSAAKLFFAYGLGNALSFPLSVGATVVLMAGRPTPESVFQRWIDHQPTVFFGSPTGYAGMLASPALPAREQIALRLASSAGEALPADLGERFTRHFGVEIIDGIGSTEMLHIFMSNRPGQVRYGTSGRPVPGYQIELRDESGHPVAEGETGDLYVSGPSSALLYWCNRGKSRETFCGAWTKSGDKYLRNSDGTYTYAGRSDDMLKVSGIYVSPFEVEATLVEHPAVLEAAVIGVADGDGLMKTKAFVVLKDGQQLDAVALKEFVKSRLAPYKYPRLIEFVPELPKTATGKIQRFKLRAQETEAAQ